MWECIVILGLGAFIMGTLWLLQPYREWKKSHCKRAQQQIVITSSNGQKQYLEQWHRHSRGQNQPKLSLVVPSYNEEERLPVMLAETVGYLNSQKQSDYEVIIVNDGSKDKTAQVAFNTARQLAIQHFYVVEYPRNRGKGGAVKAGMAFARGQYILMVDADGATDFSSLGKFQQKMHDLETRLDHPLIMIVGSRAMFSEETKVQRKLHRRFVSAVFRVIKSGVCGVRARDTQCGFKYFTRQSARQLFQVLHIQKWAFDIELFYLSSLFGIHIQQVPVEWRDVDGSKLNVLEASINMFRDLLMIRLLYLFRLWKPNDRMVLS